jgi:hypothetical protein
VEKKDAKVGEIAHGLRRLVNKTVAGASESVNPWKLPTFESNGPMCYFSAGKNYVTFGFLRGTSLPDPAKLLEGTGKSLRHVKLHSADDLRKPALKKIGPSGRAFEQGRANGRYETKKQAKLRIARLEIGRS